MNSFFAAGLFDSPWILLVLVIFSALANWISKRREQKQAEQQPKSDEPAPASGKPAEEFNLEETLRRLMGEEPPAATPAPPPLPRPARGELRPAPTWQEEEPLRPEPQTIPGLRPPIIAVAEASGTTTATAISAEQAQAARRFEQLNEQGRHPATVVGHGRGYRSAAGQRDAAQWRNPRRARQAFVASLIFAPPKGLEN